LSPQRKRPPRFVRWVVVCACVVLTLLAGRLTVSWCSVRMADRALTRHDVVLAASWLHWARTINDENAEAHFLTARVSRRLGDSQGLQKHLKRAHQLGWPELRLQREWTLAQAQIGLLKQAEPHLENLLVNAGEDGAEICAAFVCGFVHHYQFQRAILLLDVWEKDFPDDSEPHLMRGRLHQRWRNWSAAETEYREALKRRSNDFDARCGLAEVLATQHKYEEAARHYSALLKGDPDNAVLMNGWADCQMHLGRPEDASAAYRKLLANDQNDCSARLGLGQMALEDRRYDEALSWLEPAAAACPRRPDVLYALAQALVAAGRREEAKQHFRYFDEANSALIKVSELMSHLVEYPNDLDARFEVGRLYMKYGTPAEGANWLKTVLAIAPNHQPTHALLEQYYDETHQAELAQQHRLQMAAPPSATAVSIAPALPGISPPSEEVRPDAQR